VPFFQNENGEFELEESLRAKHRSGVVKGWGSAVVLEGFASDTCLLSEQIWDGEDKPDVHMYLGKPTGAAMPLMWAHSEYIKLLRSIDDNRVFDFIPEVADRYLVDRSGCKSLEVWKFNRQVKQVKTGENLRIHGLAPYQLHWSIDNWQTVNHTPATPTKLGVSFVDIFIGDRQQGAIDFTFFWIESNSWEQHNYMVLIE
jgi:glucoamylase